MVVCGNCKHKRTFHKKADGNLWCSVPTCACKKYKEVEVDFNRREVHQALDNLLDKLMKPQK